MNSSEHLQFGAPVAVPDACKHENIATTGNVTMEGGILESPETTLERSDDEIALQGFCSPKKPLYKILGLALMCLLGFGTIVTVIAQLTLQRDQVAIVHYLYLIAFVSVHYDLIECLNSSLNSVIGMTNICYFFPMKFFVK